MFFEAIAIGGLGLVSALGLGVAAKVFAVEVDPLVEAIEDALAGANCGGCGYASCSAAAVAIASGKLPPNSCVGGGPEIGENVAKVMGVTVTYREPEVSQVDCTYGVHDAATKYEYDGVLDCRAAVMLAGGPKVCPVGCIGLGTCVSVCPFGAITIGPDRLPKVDPLKCTGCGNCERACPKNIIHLTNVTNRILGFNADYNCLAPCQATCPAQIDIPGYIRAIGEGKPEEAVRIIKEHNPLPLTCGRVCPHPCEDQCRRGLEGEPVNINHIKRYAADWEMAQGKHVQPFCMPKTGKKVAIIGGGPAGLTCAYYLARLGHSPTIFEAQPHLGGMLRYGIPQYRLPKEILDFEIQGILDLGCEAKTEHALGRDFTLDSLRADGFEAIFMGLGCWNSRSMRVDGEDLEGVLPGTNMLIDRGNKKETPVGERVVIIGGGNTAMDCARTCWRLGAKEVVLLYRRSRQEMPANDIEVEEAEHEGVKFIFLAAPTKLVGENGKLKALEYIKMELGEPDASGRRRPVPVEGSETLIECDNVISAIGQFADLSGLEDDGLGQEIQVSRWNTIDAENAEGMTNIPGVFAGGDGVHGAATAVEAIGAGRRAARAMHLYLAEEDPNAPGNWVTKPREVVTVKDIPGAPEPGQRVKMPELSVDERRMNFEEVELGLTEEMARQEAQRCLQCGLVCYKGVKTANPGPEPVFPMAMKN